MQKDKMYEEDFAEAFFEVLEQASMNGHVIADIQGNNNTTSQIHKTAQAKLSILYDIFQMKPSNNVIADMKLFQFDEFAKYVLQYLFSMYDVDKNGILDMQECQNVLKDVLTMNVQDVDTALKIASTVTGQLSKKDTITFAEFSLAMKNEEIQKELHIPTFSAPITKKSVQRILSLFGVAPSGNILKDLLHVYDSLQQEASVLKITTNMMFANYDVNESGAIDRLEAWQAIKDLHVTFGMEFDAKSMFCSTEFSYHYRATTMEQATIYE